MRKIISVVAIAAAALALTACGTTETANSTANAMVTEMNTADAMEGTTNDTMTPVDAAAGASTNMTTDNAMMGNAADNAMMGNAAGAGMNTMNAGNAAK